MEQELIQPEEIEEKIDETPEVVEVPEGPDIAALTAQLAEAQSTITEHHRTELIRRTDEAGIGGLEKLLPFIDISKIDDANFDVLMAALKVAGPKRKPNHIGTQTQVGESSNGGRSDDRSPQIMLEQAAAKARKSGKSEDISAYSKLKRKLGEFK